MAKRVLVGQLRRMGREYVVLRTFRHRGATHVVLGVMHAGEGRVVASETRAYATVARWPCVGRMRISVRLDPDPAALLPTTYYAAPR